MVTVSHCDLDCDQSCHKQPILSGDCLSRSIMFMNQRMDQSFGCPNRERVRALDCVFRCYVVADPSGTPCLSYVKEGIRYNSFGHNVVLIAGCCTFFINDGTFLFCFIFDMIGCYLFAIRHVFDPFFCAQDLLVRLLKSLWEVKFPTFKDCSGNGWRWGDMLWSPIFFYHVTNVVAGLNLNGYLAPCQCLLKASVGMNVVMLVLVVCLVKFEDTDCPVIQFAMCHVKKCYARFLVCLRNKHYPP